MIEMSAPVLLYHPASARQHRQKFLYAAIMPVQGSQAGYAC